MSEVITIGDRAAVVHADCKDYLQLLPDASVDAIVTDPPYGLGDTSPAKVAACLRAWLDGDEHEAAGGGFMGRAWDSWVPGPRVWRECLRVLKPGGHLLAFAGSRTVDLMGMALRLAGFEVRDSLQWLYGTGFPKSLDVSKAIDARPGVVAHDRFAAELAAARASAGMSRADVSEQVVGTRSGACWNWEHHQFLAARHWPALARALPALSEAWQPLLAAADRAKVGSHVRDMGGFAGSRLGAIGGDITAPATDAARQWDGWGTALKPAAEPILLCRKPLSGTVAANVLEHGVGGLNVDGCRVATTRDDAAQMERCNTPGSGQLTRGRWPPNVLLAHPPGCDGDNNGAGCVEGCAVGTLGEQSGGGKRAATAGATGGLGDTGTAARFFPSFRFRYVPKPRRAEREAGLVAPDGQKRANTHPTVKPVDLMRWLVRLVTPRGGVVLDPFTGSGTTGVAAVREGVFFMGIERDPESVRIAVGRIKHVELEADDED